MPARKNFSQDTEAFLASIQPFAALPAGGREAIARTAVRQSFSKDDTIFNEGDGADSVWVVCSGRVQVLKYVSDGRPFAIESLGPGELFGTLCRMGGNSRSYPCTAVAAAETVALKIPDGIFVRHYLENPGMMRGVCSLCSDRLRDVQDLRCMGQEPVRVKLAAILTRLRLVHGDTIPFTKKQISELIGVAVETTFRALAEMQEKGWLESGRGNIRLKQPDKIRGLAGSL